MIMKTKFLTLFSALLLFSCTGSFILEKSKVLNNADLSSYKTFMMQTPQEKNIPDKMSIIDVRNLYESVVKQMIERGYVLVRSNPDIIVNLAVSIEQKIETKDAIPPGTGVGYRYFGARAAYASSYYSNAQIISDIRIEGLLMLDIVDARKEQYVYVSEISTVKSNQFKDLATLNQAVALLFKKFPVEPLVSTDL